MFYISLTKSKVVWTEAKKSRVKPLIADINAELEEIYMKHQEERQLNPNDKAILAKHYRGKTLTDIQFGDDTVEYVSAKGRRKIAKRQALEGFWIEYFSSAKCTTIHLRINSLQIDNELDSTIFPVMLHPVAPKASPNEYADKAFLELSIYETKTAKSNIVQFKYFKILIQEFAINIDQGLIVALLAFLAPQSVR